MIFQTQRTPETMASISITYSAGGNLNIQGLSIYSGYGAPFVKGLMRFNTTKLMLMSNTKQLSVTGSIANTEQANLTTRFRYLQFSEQLNCICTASMSKLEQF